MISAVVLTHNDQVNLHKTLASVAWCDERIVIDDESADGTKKTAETCGATVYVRKLSNDFAVQRNFGLSKAKGEWILFVDSDEIVSGALRDEILRAIRIPDCDGYEIRRVDTVFGKKLTHGEVGSVRLLRLAKKNAGVWIRPVHEVWKISGKTGVLDNPLEHYPHPDVAQFLSDVNTYSTLNAEYLFSENIREPVWYIMVYPVAKFFRNYILHRGFLDGTAGAILAIMMSFHSFLTRAKLYMLHHKSGSRLRP